MGPEDEENDYEEQIKTVLTTVQPDSSNFILKSKWKKNTQIEKEKLLLFDYLFEIYYSLDLESKF